MDSTLEKLKKMAIGNPERDSEKIRRIRKQLSIAVRSVQWSYGIFWSRSTTQEGKLVWDDGYYNGEIKTRKKVQPEKVYDDTLGFCRSEQLRELFESKEEGSRPADVLSRKELSDLETYYLDCMSHKFEVGKCSHGKALNTSQLPLWHPIDKEAKKASVKSVTSVKTVICFPHEGGVLELGVTDLVKKDSDPNLIQYIKTCLELLDSKDDGKGASADKPQPDKSGSSETKDTEEPVDVVGQTSDNKASDSDENLKVDETLEKGVQLVVTFPSAKEALIVLTFPPRNYLVKKIGDAVKSMRLDNHLFNANVSEGTQKITIKAQFKVSKSELAENIKQAVLEAIRTIPE